MSEKLNSEERKLLEDLINYRKDSEKDWKKSLQRGLKIPEKGLEKRLSGENYGPAVDSLEGKGLIEIEEKKITVDKTD